MRKNCNFSRPVSRKEYFSDGVVQVLPIDDFPVSDPSFYKQDGFPCNEIGLLDRFSTQHFDKETFDLIASRVQELSVNPDDGLTDAQKLRILKPAFVQTASETAAYEEYVYNLLSEWRANKSVPLPTDDTVTKTDDVKEVSSSSQSGDSSEQ